MSVEVEVMQVELVQVQENKVKDDGSGKNVKRKNKD